MSYDALGRVQTIGLRATTASPAAYTSTATLTWDKGNRLTNISSQIATKYLVCTHE